MFNNHTAAFRVAQVGADKIYIYNAIGIPKENIKYETEFVNRTKETYLNIKGEHKVEGIGFENELMFIYLLILMYMISMKLISMMVLFLCFYMRLSMRSLF